MQREAKLFRRGTAEEKLYHVWYNMIDRCFNSTHSAYKRYGGRGIKVCTEWRTFAAFLEWAQQDYQAGLWLDREKKDGDYSPSNCRWITPDESRDNVRGTWRLTAFGETKTVAQWSRDPRCKVRRDTLRQRIKYGYAAEQAITTPVGLLK